MQNFPYVITVSSEKGGVGKTTLATNLAIFLKALHEELPVTIFSFDNHFTVDKMFAINGQQPEGSVADLLAAVPAVELVRTGQYGIGYISSSATLAECKASIKSPMALARFMALSQLPGIVIIDTRPDLDILTQNALYAADQVIIPVKDMPSLENCRNIFELFDKRGFDKKSLALIPCLIDTRIKFDGPFKDQSTLLKAYAINRGYRCLDMFISKNPKVESLNTNPDGRIYPILTHAQDTDVYNQFAQLAKSVSDAFRETLEPRALLFHEWLTAEDDRKKESYAARLAGVRNNCLVCRQPLMPEASEPAAYYFEASDGGAVGFIGDSCFHGFLTSAIYKLGKEIAPGNPAWEMVSESARDSTFVFKPVDNGGGKMLEFYRFDLEGYPLLKKIYPLREFEGGLLRRERSKLFTFVSTGLAMDHGNLRNEFLLVYPVDPKAPQSILREEQYRQFSRLKQRIASQLEN